MPRFSARTIAIVRRAVNEMLTDTCSLYQESGATGTMGEPLHNLELVASGVPCRVIRAKTPSSNAVQVVGSQDSQVERYRFECPYDQALRIKMVVELDSDGSRWQMVDVEDALTDKAFAGAVITRVRT